MTTRLRLSLLLGVPALLAALLTPAAPRHDERPAEDVRSEMRVTDAGERILVQEGWFDAPVADVWAAYTTAEGWQGWAAPQASVDLRVGGTILTNYDPDAELGGPGTNTLHIVNYVPEEVLTLRAELSDNWPEIMKEDADRMSNVVVFRSHGDALTQVVSYGIGYRDVPEYDRLLAFFSEANVRLMRGLATYLATGEPQVAR